MNEDAHNNYHKNDSSFTCFFRAWLQSQYLIFKQLMNRRWPQNHDLTINRQPRFVQINKNSALLGYIGGEGIMKYLQESTSCDYVNSTSED